MRRLVLTALVLCTGSALLAQKKPLDHSVYDGWQNIGEKKISNDGKWVAYSVDVQEGDNELVIQSADSVEKKHRFPRGYNAVITEDGRFVVFKIKPLYKEVREARIKKKKPEDMPKDSLGVFETATFRVQKFARVKTYKTPQKESGWLAYHLDKQPETEKPKTGTTGDKKMIDSLQKQIDSLTKLVSEQNTSGKKKRKDIAEQEGEEPDAYLAIADAEGDDTAPGAADAGTDLVLRKLENGNEKVFKNVTEYHFDKRARKLLVETAKNPKDSLSKAMVLLHDLNKGITDTLLKGGNDFRNYALTDDASQIAFVAERDSSAKALQKFYKLWYYKEGMDSAIQLVDKNNVGMRVGMTVSENGQLSFSKSGKRLFFGSSIIQAPRDTSLVDMDKVNLDIWHYKDDYLQPQQLRRLQTDLQQNYLAVYHLETGSLKQLGTREMPIVTVSNEGDGNVFLGVTDWGKRTESQWTGNTLKNVYAIDPVTGDKKLVKENLNGFPSISSTGKYIFWYDRKARHYFAWNGNETQNISEKIKFPLWNEDNDVPDDPPAYGIMGWHQGDSAVYVYDRYDVWKVNPESPETPVVFTDGRKTKLVHRYVKLDPEEFFIKNSQLLTYRVFSEVDKTSVYHFNLSGQSGFIGAGRYSYSGLQKAKNSDRFIFNRENFYESPDLFTQQLVTGYNNGTDKGEIQFDTRLSAINLQQLNYTWGTAELFKWKAYDGKENEGVLYKPENFDPKKKYPMICYFYETHSETLHQYNPPSPTPSRLNIPFFVSRGYIVFSPDIHYGTGHPARDCYNHVVSGARELVKRGFVDSTKIGVQGQSWGGIQVAQLITMTNLFKAAWAGAPVANMTSAYGGIRWGTGLNRQFQYEKTQSRIGATLWEKPELYIENSPLFHLPKVNTPLVIMHNDADGAVPWYQGIELFTGLRRLGKPVWMLNYNGEDHNLVERKNRKDIQIREQQFFDWLLKGEKPAKWIVEGVPATKKGKEWGLELVNE